MSLSYYFGILKRATVGTACMHGKEFAWICVKFWLETWTWVIFQVMWLMG